MAADAAIKLIRDTLAYLNEESLILASPEDAQYFRALAKKRLSAPPASEPHATIPAPRKTPIPSPPATPIIETPIPSPPAAPIIETPIPSPPAAPVIETPVPPPPPLPPSAPRWRQESAPRSLSSPSFDAVKLLLQKVAPEMPLIDEIPNDANAKKVASRWKTKNQTAPISILYLTEPSPQKTLLEEIAVALDVYFGPARLIAAEPIEKEKQWDTFLSVSELKLVIACDYTLWQLSSLMQHYKENPASSTRSLKNVPLLLLPDLSLYLKDPLLKRSLWKALCQKLSS